MIEAGQKFGKMLKEIFPWVGIEKSKLKVG